MAHVVEIDIVEVCSETGEHTFHAYVNGVLGADGGRKMLYGRKFLSGGTGYLFTEGEDAYSADGALVAVPGFEGNNYRTLVRRMAKHYGLTGTALVDDETGSGFGATYAL